MLKYAETNEEFYTTGNLDITNLPVGEENNYVIAWTLIDKVLRKNIKANKGILPWPWNDDHKLYVHIMTTIFSCRTYPDMMVALRKMMLEHPTCFFPHMNKKGYAFCYQLVLSLTRKHPHNA